MSIFPPDGASPGLNTCHGYLPTNPVIGEGPFYYAPDCSTFLTDCAMNSVVSEILAAVDALGFGYNTTRINNLGEALAARFTAQQIDIDDKVAKSGDTMTGALVVPCPPENDGDAACKLYVDETLDACCQDVRNQLANAVINLRIEFDAKVNDRVHLAGDHMTGPLILSDDAITLDDQAATKRYVDLSVQPIIIAPTAPPTVLPGRLWWDSSSGQLFIGYDDGDSEQWVGVSAAAGPGGVSGDFLPLVGGTLTGSLMLHASPTTGDPALQAATKGYVDSMVASGGTFVDAPPDGQIYARQMNNWVPITVSMDGGSY